MIYINITNYVVISQLEKHCSMIEMHCFGKCNFFPNKLDFV